MVTGFNTDVQHEGKVFHVQTEDKGTDNPIIETLVYRGGEILAARRSSYADLVRDGMSDAMIAERIEAQHDQMIDDIRAGKYDAKSNLPFGAGIITDRSFDEVVLQYIKSLSGSDPIVLEMDPTPDLIQGSRARLDLKVSRQEGGQGVSGALVRVRAFDASGTPRVLTQGKTGEDGRLRLSCALPVLPAGQATLSIQAMNGGELAEIRHPIEAPARRAAG